MTDPEPVRIEVTLPRPVGEVWRAFRDPSLIRQWFGWEYDGLDDEIRHAFTDGTIASEAEHTLHIGGHLFTVVELGAQTVVRVTRAAPVESGEAMDWDAWYDDIDEGWLTFLQQLRFALAHHWGADRATVYLSGEAIADPPVPVTAAFGLETVATLGPGARYDAEVAGERLAGEVWFRSEHQLGLTVDAWGPGLLVLAEAPNAARRSASAVLTTYGEPDGDRGSRWRAAWATAYREAPPSG